jgi:hypothetical protein
MGTKVPVNTITAGYGSTTALNTNYDALSDALDLVLWADGTVPWTGNQDANSKRLTNLPVPVNNTEPVRLADLPSSTTVHTAALTTIVDAGGYFSSDNVEGALQELGAITVTIGTYSDSLTSAIASIGSTKTTLIIDKEITLTQADTVPDNISLKFLRGGSLTGAYTTTINGTIDAGLWQIFDSSMTVDASGNNKVSEAYPEWFGAVIGQSVDQSTAFTAALAAFDYIKLSGEYALGTQISIGNDKIIEGTGTKTGFYLLSALSGFGIKITGTTGNYYQYKGLKNLLINANGENAINIDDSYTHALVEDVSILGPAIGIEFTNTVSTGWNEDSKLRNVTIRNLAASGKGIHVNGSNVSRCRWENIHIANTGASAQMIHVATGYSLKRTTIDGLYLWLLGSSGASGFYCDGEMENTFIKQFMSEAQSGTTENDVEFGANATGRLEVEGYFGNGFVNAADGSAVLKTNPNYFFDRRGFVDSFDEVTYHTNATEVVNNLTVPKGIYWGTVGSIVKSDGEIALPREATGPINSYIQSKDGYHTFKNFEITFNFDDITGNESGSGLELQFGDIANGDFVQLYAAALNTANNVTLREFVSGAAQAVDAQYSWSAIDTNTHTIRLEYVSGTTTWNVYIDEVIVVSDAGSSLAIPTSPFGIRVRSSIENTSNASDINIYDIKLLENIYTGGIVYGSSLSTI